MILDFTPGSCRSSSRQPDNKRSPFSRLTSHLDLPPQRVHIFTALVGANTHACIAFGGIKGAEQTMMDKFRCHPASRIPDFNNGPTFFLIQDNPDLPTGFCRILGIAN